MAQVELRCRADQMEEPLTGGPPRFVPMDVQLGRHLRWLTARMPSVRELDLIAMVGISPTAAPQRQA